YYIFQGEDENWYCPEDIYLDRPYKPTDLSAYFGRIEGSEGCTALHASYENCSIALKRIRAFAESVGVRVELKIERGYCQDNPQWAYLRSVSGDRFTSPLDKDYFIPKIPELLDTPSLELSRLIWRTLTSFPPGSDYLQAAYRRNHSGGTRYADSRLVHELR